MVCPAYALLVIDWGYSGYLAPRRYDDGGLGPTGDAAMMYWSRAPFSAMFRPRRGGVGWGYSRADLIAAMNRIRRPFSFSIAASRAGRGGTRPICASSSRAPRFPC